MRRILVASALLVSVAGLARAQAPVMIPGQGGRAASNPQILEFLLSHAFKDIALSTAQKDTVEVLIQASIVEIQAMLATAPPDFQTRRDALIAKRNAAFRALLTTDRDRARFDVNIRALYP